MTHSNTNAHTPVADLLSASKSLDEQSTFAHRQAATCAQRAQTASADLAALDINKAFEQLRQMVAMVGGKSAIATQPVENVIAFPNKLAAE